MDNQIELYHDATAFWVDKECKTPKEKKLEQQIVQLSQQIGNLKAQNKALAVRLGEMESELGKSVQEYEEQLAQLRRNINVLKVQNERLQEELEPLQAFKSIPCRVCHKPVSFTRGQVLEAFKTWGHKRCIEKEQEPNLVIIKAESWPGGQVQVR